MSLFADDIILYILIENPIDSTIKLLELINEFSKLVGYKISVQQLVAFLCINNRFSEKGIRKLIPFAIASKTIKYLGINLTKEVKDLYTENYKTSMKEIEKEVNGKVSCVHRLEKLIL